MEIERRHGFGSSLVLALNGPQYSRVEHREVLLLMRIQLPQRRVEGRRSMVWFNFLLS